MDALTAELDRWLYALSPSARLVLARDIAKSLAASQRARIASQRNPDGSAYVPRKTQAKTKAGSIKRGAMFKKLGTARYMRATSTADAVTISFVGHVQRMAQVHQFGWKDSVFNEGRKGPTVKYAARELLGITEQERETLTDLILRHLTA